MVRSADPNFTDSHRITQGYVERRRPEETSGKNVFRVTAFKGISNFPQGSKNSMERLGRALRGIWFRTNVEISLGGHHLIPKKFNRVHRWY